MCLHTLQSIHWKANCQDVVSYDQRTFHDKKKRYFCVSHSWRVNLQMAPTDPSWQNSRTRSVSRTCVYHAYTVTAFNQYWVPACEENCPEVLTYDHHAFPVQAPSCMSDTGSCCDLSPEACLSRFSSPTRPLLVFLQNILKKMFHLHISRDNLQSIMCPFIFH